MCSIILSFLLASWIRYGSITKNWFDIDIYGGAAVIVVLLYMVIYYLFDTYSKLFKRGFLEEMLVVVKINFTYAITLMAVMFLFQRGIYYSRLIFLCFFLLNILISYILRQYFKLLLLGVYKKSSSSYKIMIITTSDQVTKVLAKVNHENEWEYQIAYLTILDKDMIGQRIHDIEVKANASNMFDIAKNEAIDGVVLSIFRMIAGQI